MGPTVLDPGNSPAPNLHLYAHCLRGQPGGVAVLAINLDRATSHSIELPAPAERYTLTASRPDDSVVQLNGRELRLGGDDALPELTGFAAPAGTTTLAPESITFLSMANVNNRSCQ